MSVLTKSKLLLGLFIILLIIVLTWIIHQKTSSNLTSEKFAEVYVKLAIARRASGSDASKWITEKERILKEHNLSSEKINQFIKKYDQTPEKWAPLWEKIISRLQEKQGKLTNPPPSP